MDIEKRIKEIEDELKITKYNKSTEKHILKLKARLTFLKKQLEEQKRREKKRVSKAGVKKQGDARVALIGPPSVGKSMLFNRLTNARSEVGDYAFTTLDVHPGILKHKGAEIQILDMPGLIEGAAKGRGNGREILSMARDSDLILILLDIYNLDLDTLLKELYEFGIRINKKQPKITLKKTEKGGIKIASTVPLSVSEDVLKSIAWEFGYRNAEILIKEDITAEDFMDFLAGNRVYIPAILVINKIDMGDREYIEEIKKMFEKWSPLFISAEKEINLDRLKDLIFEKIGLIRVYLKPQSGKVDYSAPLILRKGDTIEDVCNAIHRDFVKKFRYAMVWGKSAKYPGQRVGLEHMVEDEDVVRLIIKK